jgi:DNA repair protein RadC
MDNLFNISEVEVSYKTKFKMSERPQITNSTDIYKVFKQIWSDNIEYVEEFYIILLSRANRVLGAKKISQGGQAGTVADIKVIMQTALKGHAAGIILGHNHPSGNLKPSTADITLTRRAAEVGKLLDLPVLDHLIMGIDNDYYSFADEGMMY